MKTKIFIILMSVGVLVFGQQTKEWLHQLENPEYEIDQLDDNDYKSQYLKYDFSTLLMPKNEFLGYIGNNYKRLKIFYTSISKDKATPDKYIVKGQTMVGNHINDFKGEIKIDEIRTYKTMHYGVDDMYKNQGIQSQGILIGQYSLVENPNQRYAGTFKGIVTLKWYVDSAGEIHYDDIQRYADRYRNNQYVGQWVSHKTGEEKISNWGEYRIPFSGDLDGGAGEFSPNIKYKDLGWEDLIKY